MASVAEALSTEWQGSGTRVYALTDYYRKGREYLGAWLLAEYGYDAETVGSQAGISDTSQMMYIHPDGIRVDKKLPGGGGPDAGVRGDPTKATAEIGRMGTEFKSTPGSRSTARSSPLRARGRRGG